MSKRKNNESCEPPTPPLGLVLNDFMIDMKVEELRYTISVIEKRIGNLIGQKGNQHSFLVDGWIALVGIWCTAKTTSSCAVHWRSGGYRFTLVRADVTWRTT
jgi:hypothetical protein